MAGNPPCTAIVVSFNSREEIGACLSSLEAQRGVELTIHVVDNASSDGSAELIRERFPKIRLEVSARNVGFGRANNLVLVRDPAPFFALVNPDTVIPSGAIAKCLEHLRQNPSVGIVGTRLVSAEGRPQRTGHAFLSLGNLFTETFGLEDFVSGGRPSLGGWRIGPSRPADVDWLTGAFLVFRREVVDQVGAFDPQFFMYGEEMEWCYRARRAGWRIVYLPEPPVVHLGGASSRPMAGPMFVENLQGRLRFLRKHRGSLVTLGARALTAISILLRFALRELQVPASRLRGREPSASLLQRRIMFRSAFRWVLAGMPIQERSP